MRDHDAFLDLMEAVEEVGGVHLTGPCEGYKYSLEMPSAMTESGQRKRTFTTTQCRQAARFVIPYELEDGSQSTLVACAFDDGMQRWPRFQGGAE